MATNNSHRTEEDPRRCHRARRRPSPGKPQPAVRHCRQPSTPASHVPKSTPSHSGESLFTGVWLHSVAAFSNLGVSQRCSSCAMSFTPYTILKASTNTQRRRRTNVRALVTPSPVGVVMVIVVQPSPPSPRPAMRGRLNENAGINGVGHAVHVVDIARVHRRRMVTAAFKLDRQFNGLIDVGDPHDRQNRHHQFGYGKRVSRRGFDEQQPGLLRYVQTNRRSDFSCVATYPVTTDRAFTAFIDIFRAAPVAAVRPEPWSA